MASGGEDDVNDCGSMEESEALKLRFFSQMAGLMCIKHLGVKLLEMLTASGRNSNEFKHADEMILLLIQFKKDLADEYTKPLGEETFDALCKEAQEAADEQYTSWVSERIAHTPCRSANSTPTSLFESSAIDPQSRKRRSLPSPKGLFPTSPNSGSYSPTENNATSDLVTAKAREMIERLESENREAMQQLEREKSQLNQQLEGENELLREQLAAEKNSNAERAGSAEIINENIQMKQQIAVLKRKLDSLDGREPESDDRPYKRRGKKKRKKASSASDEQHSEAEDVSTTLLADCRRDIQDIAARLPVEHVVVANFPVVQLTIELLRDAFDPWNPRLSRVIPITKSLAAMIRIIENHKKAMEVYINALRSRGDAQDTLIDFDDTDSIGTMLTRIDANNEKKARLENTAVPDSAKSVLLALKSAMRVMAGAGSGNSQSDNADATGTERPLSLSDDDVEEMSKKFKFEQVIENLIGQCLNLTLFIRVAPKVTLSQLKLNHDDLARAEKLWGKLRPGVPFETKGISLLQFHEVVLLPALVMDDSKKIAIDLICCTIRELTDTRKGGKKETFLPLWSGEQKTTIDGGVANCEVDYCAGEDKGNTRLGIVSIYLCLALQHEIPTHLPGNTFPLGFTRTMLTNSQSYTRMACTFHSKRKSMFFDSEQHGKDSAWCKLVNKRMTHWPVGKTPVILTEIIVKDLLQLLEE